MDKAERIYQYLEKYCKKHKVKFTQAIKHQLVQDYIKYVYHDTEITAK